jgi:hypothetical protein
MLEVRPFAEKDRPALEAIYRDCRMEWTWLPPAVRERSDFSRDTEGETIVVAVGGDDAPQGFVSVWRPKDSFTTSTFGAASRRKGIGKRCLMH